MSFHLHAHTLLTLTQQGSTRVNHCNAAHLGEGRKGGGMLMAKLQSPAFARSRQPKIVHIKKAHYIVFKEKHY